MSQVLRAARAAFRHDIAEQLRSLGGDVTGGGERLAVELQDAGGEAFRVVAGFNEDGVGRTGWSEWLQLRVETADGRWPVLTLGWTSGDSDGARLALYERLTAGNLPAEQRGLNAAADVREGRYARTDAVHALHAELLAAAGTATPRAVVRLVSSRGPVAAVEPVRRPALAAAGTELEAAGYPEAAEARLGAALEAMPDGMRQEALRQFLAYLASHEGGGGLTAADVQALVAEGMRDLRDHYDAHLNGQSVLTGVMARGRGMALVGALAVAYGAEVMTSGFAFGDMIKANALNWPLAFTSSFLFGGGLIALAPTEKQRQFWGRVGLGFALTVAGLSATNRSLVDPLRERIGTFLYPEATAGLRADAARKQAAFKDLEAKLAAKRAAAAQDRTAYLSARRNRPAVMRASGKAAEATEAQRDAAREAAFAAKQKSEAAERAGPANYAAAALAFVLAGTITGAGQWFIGNYLNSRIGVHQEALQAARTRRRMWRRAKRLTGRDAQTDRAQMLLAMMRAEYWRRLEQSGRLPRGEVKARVERAFGKTAAESQAIVTEAVRRFRGGWNWGGLFQGRRPPPGVTNG